MARQWHDIPFPPRRWPFFYGWVIVAASTVGMLASLPGQTMGVGVFTDDLVEALGVTRVNLSTAYMFGTIISSLILPLAGSLLDRLGSRAMVVVASLGLGASTLGLSCVDRIATKETSSVLVVTVVMTVAFLMLRFFGQGCLTMTSRVAIGKWFDHHRGLAMAISGVFVSFGFSASPFLLNWMLETLGWRGACVGLGLIVGGGMTLLGWLLYRDNPEECGLVMDGVRDPVWHAKMAAKAVATQKEFTRSEALRTWSFWVFNIGTSTQGLILTALTFHVASIGAESGLTRDEAYSIFIPMSVFSVTVGFAGGWLSDRVRLKWLLIVMMIAQGIGTVGLLDYGDRLGQALVIVGYGVANGLFGFLTGVTWPRFFGRRHLGAISGANMSAMVFASAIGPVLFAKGFDMTGSFYSVTAWCLSMPIIVAVCAIKADNPQRKLSQGD